MTDLNTTGEDTTSSQVPLNDEGQSTIQHVDAVAANLKLPPFWTVNPALWFAQVDALFQLRNIRSDNTKYLLTVANLDQHTAALVDDLLMSPPAEGNKYVTLRTELVKRLSLSQERKIRQLLHQEQLGDQRPSQFLRRLQSLTGEMRLQDDFLRSIWVQRLPAKLQLLLSSQPSLSLSAAADLADSLFDILSETPEVCAVSTVSASSSTNAIAELRAEMARMNRRIDSLFSAFNKRRFRSKSRDASVATATSPSAGSADQNICYYHAHFGNKAHRCTPPCNFQENTQA